MKKVGERNLLTSKRLARRRDGYQRRFEAHRMLIAQADNAFFLGDLLSTFQLLSFADEPEVSSAPKIEY